MDYTSKDWKPPVGFPNGRFEGSPAEVGFAHGRQFGEQVLGCIRSHRASIEKTGLAWGRALDLAERGRGLLDLVDPKLIAEMDGIAKGAEVDRREIYAVNNRVALTRIAALDNPAAEVPECTTAAALGAITANGHTYLAQNWDQSSELQANLVVIEQHVPDEPAILFITEAGRLILHGMNDAGVGVVGNALGCNEPTHTDRTFISAGARRRALRHRTLDAAYRTIIDSPQGQSGNHMLADKSGRAIDIEAVPSRYYSVPPEAGVISHANHYLHPDAQTEIVDTILSLHGSTVYRQARLRDALLAKSGALTVADIQAALCDHHGFPAAICSHPHETKAGGCVHTLCTTIMDLNEGRLLTTPGPTCMGTFAEYRFS